MAHVVSGGAIWFGIGETARATVAEIRMPIAVVGVCMLLEKVCRQFYFCFLNRGTRVTHIKVSHARTHARQRHGGRWGNRSAADGHSVRWRLHLSRSDLKVCLGMAALHHRWGDL
jgi:hypothetical protein